MIAYPAHEMAADDIILPRILWWYVHAVNMIVINNKMCYSEILWCIMSNPFTGMEFGFAVVFRLSGERQQVDCHSKGYGIAVAR